MNEKNYSKNLQMLSSDQSAGSIGNKKKDPFTITISGDDTAENIKKAQTLSKHFDEGSTGIMTQTFGAK